MNNVEPRGAVHWIDHYVVGTNDMTAWVDWAVNATGIMRRPIIGLTTAARKRNIKITSFLWWDGGSCRIGAFLQQVVLRKKVCKPHLGRFIHDQPHDHGLLLQLQHQNHRLREERIPDGTARHQEQ